MQLSQLDSIDLFSLTMWKSADGCTVGMQRRAGDQVRYATRNTVSEAITAVIELPEPETPTIPAPPF